MFIVVLLFDGRFIAPRRTIVEQGGKHKGEESRRLESGLG